MEDKELEKLFKDDFNKLRSFSNAEHQWQVVENRLKSRKIKGFPFWFLTAGLILIAASFFWVNIDVAAGSHTMRYEKSANESQTAVDEISDPMDVNKRNEVASIAEVDLQIDERIFDESLEKNQIENKDKGKIVELDYKPVGLDDSKSTKVYSTLVKNDLKQNGSLNSSNDDCVVCEEEARTSKENVNATKVANNNYEDIIDEEEVMRSMMSRAEILSFQEIKLIKDLVVQKLSMSPIELTSKSRSKYLFKLKGGMRLDYLTDEMIEDNRNLRTYLGFGLAHRSGLGLDLKYSWGQIERGVLGDLTDNNVPLISYEPEQPDSTGIDFANRSIDLDLNMRLFNFKGLGLDILGGVQFNDYTRSNISYYYNEVYQVNVIEEVLPDSGWKCSDVCIGSRISYPILAKVSIVGQYQYHIPIGDSYTWGTRHRLFMGINYTINKN